MLPIRDSVPKYRTPKVVYSLIVINVLIYLYQSQLNDYQLYEFARKFGVVPSIFFLPSGFLRPDLPWQEMWPFITSGFLHGGWFHLLFNMWFLFIYGSTLESRLGSIQFLIFYLICLFASLYAHGYFNSSSPFPVIGASGAIAGVIGGYTLRFPTAQLTILLPIIIIPFIFTIPVLAYSIIWFGLQLIWATWDSFNNSLGDGIAWWAHIGGFIAGFVFLPVFLLFAPPPPKQTPWQRGPWDYSD